MNQNTPDLLYINNSFNPATPWCYPPDVEQRPEGERGHVRLTPPSGLCLEVLLVLNPPGLLHPLLPLELVHLYEELVGGVVGRLLEPVAQSSWLLIILRQLQTYILRYTVGIVTVALELNYTTTSHILSKQMLRKYKDEQILHLCYTN